MVDPLLVKRKLQKLAGYLKELETLQDLTIEEYLNDFRHRRIAERLVQLIVDIAVDINTHAVVDADNPPPDDAYSSFIEAARIGIISQELAKKLAPSTGERNVIVHEYEEIDNIVVYESISESLDLYWQYLEAVFEYTKKAGI
ncbi:MAG: type VII toxin-antitoxin system HepT family RNase toxin [Fastidiosipilaceae bacterium]